MHILLHGIIQSALLSVVLLIIGLKNRRMMLQDYPMSIRQKVPAKTRVEKNMGIAYGIPFILILIGYPIYAVWSYSNATSFLDIFLFIWGVMMFSNLYDLIILDWLIICTLTPRFVVIPGTEGDKGYKDYKFHFIAFLKGIAITFGISLVSAYLLTFFK